MTPNQGMLGFASILIDNALEISSLGIYSRLDGAGVRLTFPAKKLGNGQYKYFVKPTGTETEQEIVKAVEQEIQRLGLLNFKTKNE